MPVITVSKEYGSGGLEIAKELAKVLNIDYFDKQIVEQVAEHARVSPEDVRDFEEERHISLRAYLSKVIDIDFLKQEVEVAPGPESGYDAREKVPFNFGTQGWIDSDIYKEMIVRVISSLGQRQHVLIVGRGGQCILKDNPNTIHVRITSRFEDRVRRIMGQNPSLSEKQAEKLVRDMDRKSHDYIKYYFKEDWADPLLYHVVINTSQVNFEIAVRWLSKLAIDFKTC